MSRYVAQVYNRDGVFLEEREAAGIHGAIVAARELRTDHPTASLAIANLDEISNGRPDGLTDEERALVQGSVT